MVYTDKDLRSSDVFREAELFPDAYTITQCVLMLDDKGKEIYEDDAVIVKDHRSDTKKSLFRVLFDWRGAYVMVDDVAVRLDMLSQIEVVGHFSDHDDVTILYSI